MKLIRFGKIRQGKPGVMIDGEYFDVSLHIKDYDEEFFEQDGLAELNKIILENKLFEISKKIRLGSPIACPSKIVCVGLNYAKHAKETNATIPLEPILFLKSTTAIVGPNDDIIIPQNSVKTDWEVELAVVIGKKASYVSEQTAMKFAGYSLHNDVSKREFQMERGGTLDK